MKNFKEYLEAAGGLKEYPTTEFVWAAYRAGEVSFHKSKADAYAMSTNIEYIELESSKDARRKVFNHNVEIERIAHDFWYKDLCKEYSRFPAKVFNLIYGEGWDKSHAYGHDVVAEKFESLAYFVDDILDAAK